MLDIAEGERMLHEADPRARTDDTFSAPLAPWTGSRLEQQHEHRSQRTRCYNPLLVIGLVATAAFAAATLAASRTGPPRRSSAALDTSGQLRKSVAENQVMPMGHASHDAAKPPETLEEKDIKNWEDASVEANTTYAKGIATNITATPIVQKAQEELKAAKMQKHSAEGQIAEAAANIGDARSMNASVLTKRQRAQAMEDKAHRDISASKRAINQADMAAAVAGNLSVEARKDKADAHETLVKAQDTENKMLQLVAAGRVCRHMQRAHLPVGANMDIPAIAVEFNLSTHDGCLQWCLKHANCRQVIFTAWDHGCHLSDQATTDVIDFEDVYDATFCADKTVEEALSTITKGVEDRNPNVPPIQVCSWAGEDCSKTKCCNDAGSETYTCYKKDQWAAGCEMTSTGAPAWYQGGAVGGPRQTRELPKAGPVVLTQGTSLFCFSVVMWKAPAAKEWMDPEWKIANNWKEKGLGIFKCDGHALFDQSESTIAYNQWGQPVLANAAAFVEIWKQVQKDGNYKSYDWVVKVDSDVVFFPARLRAHLRSIRTPQKARVYLRNIDYDFQFRGALEVMTREALDLYFEQGWHCKVPAQPTGEDLFMKECLDGIGVDHQTDHSLLRDPYCQTCPDKDAGCGDEGIVAFHQFKTVNDWNNCYYDKATGAGVADGRQMAGGSTSALESSKAEIAKALQQVNGAPPDESSDIFNLREDAKTLKAQSGPALTNANEKAATAQKQAEDAAAAKEAALQTIADARESLKKAASLREEAAKDLVESGSMTIAAQNETDVGRASVADANERIPIWTKNLSQSQALQAGALGEVVKAKHMQEMALRSTSSHRLCVDLGGVRLRENGSTITFFSLPGYGPAPTTSSDCTAACKEHAECGQSSFTSDTGECRLLKARGAVMDFRGSYNSSYCGYINEKTLIMGMLKEVYDQQPWVAPPQECAWAGGDCRQSKCCNGVVCDWKYEGCKGYTCYAQTSSDDGFAGCMMEKPGNWNGSVVGGSRQPREMAKAPEGKLIHGTSLFCFIVMVPGSRASAGVVTNEGTLVDIQRKRGIGIFACDDNLVLTGYQSGMGAWGSVSNIDQFIGHWWTVKKDGRWLDHDWIVKVDADAVLFPDRLKWHLEKLRAPSGARLYLKNCNFRFQFMGAFEVMSREALELYFEKSDECSKKIGHQGGEDYYMTTCLDAIGVDHQTDFSLLHDKYAGQDGCCDDWAAAFHFYKTDDRWLRCHKQAVDCR